MSFTYFGFMARGPVPHAGVDCTTLPNMLVISDFTSSYSLATKSVVAKALSVQLYPPLTDYYIILLVNSLTVTDTASTYLVTKQFISGMSDDKKCY